MTNILIDESLLSPDKKNKLEEAIREAHGDAIKKIQQIMALKMKEMGGLPNIPGLN
jgi:DNA-binding protein YbaB